MAYLMKQCDVTVCVVKMLLRYSTRCDVTVVEPWKESNPSLYIKSSHSYNVTKVGIGFSPT